MNVFSKAKYQFNIGLGIYHLTFQVTGLTFVTRSSSWVDWLLAKVTVQNPSRHIAMATVRTLDINPPSPSLPTTATYH